MMPEQERRKAERRAEAARYTGGQRKRPIDRRLSDAALFSEAVCSDPYVRLNTNPAARWQVRRNRTDETFEVLSEHATKREAVAALDSEKVRTKRSGGAQMTALFLVVVIAVGGIGTSYRAHKVPHHHRHCCQTFDESS